MGLFGDSQQEKDLKALLQRTYDTMQKLLNDFKANNQRVTPYARQCMNQFVSEVNLLYSKSENLSAAKQMSIQIYIDGQYVSLGNSKVGFIMFMRDFERTTGEKFPFKYN
jgi:hypothetical protein